MRATKYERLWPGAYRVWLENGQSFLVSDSDDYDEIERS